MVPVRVFFVQPTSNSHHMSTAHKKVLVRRISGDVVAGYMPLHSFVHGEAGEPTCDLLDLGGRVLSLPLQQVKTICYVRDFNLSDAINPERLGRRAFLARPRNEGLWLRLTFSGGDILEGLAEPNISFLTNAIADLGVHIVPPDIRSNTQSVFVPRSAITEMQVVAVITAPSRKRLTSPPDATAMQDTLFSALASN